MPKILRHGTDALLPLRRKLSYGFLLPLKVHPLGPGLDPPTVDPMVGTLTCRPPRGRQRCWLMRHQCQSCIARLFSCYISSSTGLSGLTTATVCSLYTCALVYLIIFQHRVVDVDCTTCNTFHFTAVLLPHFYIVGVIHFN
jgi:hypothetical protein